MRSFTRWLLALAVTLPAVVLTPSSALVIADAGAILSAQPVVLIGCFGYVESPRYSCVLARHAGSAVAVAFFDDPDVAAVLDGSVEKTNLPDATLELFMAPGDLLPSVRLDAVLPVAGEIHLESRPGRLEDGFTVTGLPFSYALLDHRITQTGPGDESIISYGTDTGTVDGQEILGDGSLAYSTTEPAHVDWLFLPL